SRRPQGRAGGPRREDPGDVCGKGGACRFDLGQILPETADSPFTESWEARFTAQGEVAMPQKEGATARREGPDGSSSGQIPARRAPDASMRPRKPTEEEPGSFCSGSYLGIED